MIRRALFWLLITAAAVTYIVIVYGWWQEGNRNIDWQEYCAQYSSEIDRNKVPGACRPYYEGR